MNKKVLIIGGVAGGASAAARLRRLDENTEIIMFERGDYISYANCGLPYYIGDVINDKNKLTLQTPHSFKERFNVDVRISSEVVKINRADKFVEIKNVKTGDVYSESYDSLILSPGAEPILPKIEGTGLDGVFTLRTIPDTYKIKEYVIEKSPKSAVVVGGGYIGIEMADNLHSLGLKVSIVELQDHLIGPLDYDMACEAHNHIISKGVNLYLNNGVSKISQNAAGLTLELSDRNIDTDLVILAVGVRPDSALAKDAGLEVNSRGSICVDSKMKTSDPSIYAVGDAVEVINFVSGSKAFIPLAGPANKQGRIAADNIAGRVSEYKNTQGTSILKCFDMTVAMTGLNERDAKANGFEYEKSFTFSASHAGYYPGATNMSIKTIFEKVTGRILGVSIVGFDGVDKRCDIFATAIRAGMTVFDLTNLELSYAPPFSSAKDPVNMAGYAASNILSGDTAVFHWHDVQSLDLEKVTLLDTRTTIEFDNGNIPGSINIPVDTLRKKLDKLDRSKPVYIYCQIGLRGYVAARILVQNGFSVKNLSGGYRLYNTIYSKKSSKESVNDQQVKFDIKSKTIDIDACGLQCPGPIMKVAQSIKNASEGDTIAITATDPSFSEDVEAWCSRTGNKLVESENKNGIFKVVIQKGNNDTQIIDKEGNGKNIIVFSGDLDKAIASFIIANGSAAMGRKVSMFFTFWGLNILRKSTHVPAKKNFIEKMFGKMMPRGSSKLKLSKMNMAGMGAAMIRGIMKNKNIDSLEALIQSALNNGVELVACTMTMDIMGIKKEELIDGVTYGGVAKMLAFAEESDMSLFI